MFSGYVTDQLHDKYGFANPGAAEKPYLAALGIRGYKIDDLYTGFKNFGSRLLLDKVRSVAVNGRVLFGAERPFVVDGFACNVEHPSQDFIAHRNLNRVSCVAYFHTAGKPFRCFHGNAADTVIPYVLQNLQDNLPAPGIYLQGVKNSRNRFRAASRAETHVHDWTYNLNDGSYICHFLPSFSNLLWSPNFNWTTLRRRLQFLSFPG